jgi:hypothetical protein
MRARILVGVTAATLALAAAGCGSKGEASNAALAGGKR